ncbi:MAG: hypothetical protein KJ550_07840 [Proteobacteria bacterium]|nr:hypothetical protein [Pseudomonadota bacterium]MBU4100599.1 hypothetical protein [Pseudomonadota bacterium]MBU4504430.1 hypothetical protein [Pseudomonadota bacterium]MCG2831299.1 hypothetical protein [Desulfobacteraceae bacterium]
MKKSIKGALLSGLVFPGVGQIVLRHYKSGIAFVLTTLAALVLIIMKEVQQALIIVEKIGSIEGVIDMSTISKAAVQATTTNDSLILNLALLVIALCWIISIVDAYRIGKKMDIQ